MADTEKKIYNFPGNARSDVWKHFGFYAVDDFVENIQLDRSRAICKICRLSVKNHGNTTNLYNHVTKRHATKLGLQFPNIGERKTFQSALETELDKSTRITNAISKYIVSDLVSTTSIQSKAFKKLIHQLNPWYELPTENYFQNIHIPNVYRETKNRILRELEQNTNGTSILVEFWRNSCNAWMSISANFITNAWALKSFQLHSIQVDKPDEENVYELIETCTSMWNISMPVSVVGFELFNCEIAPLPGCDEGWTHIPCLAQTLNFAALKGFEIPEVCELVEKAQMLVRYVEKHMMEMPRITPLENVDLLLENSRWLSIYEMFSWLAANNPAMEEALCNSGTKSQSLTLLFTSEEQILTENLLLAYKELKTATNILCKETQPLVSMILPVLQKLLSSFTHCGSDNSVVTAMKETVHKHLSLAYQRDTINVFLVSSSLLDPRYKELPLVSHVQRNQARENIFSIALQLQPNSSDFSDDDETNDTLSKRDVSSIEDMIGVSPNKRVKVDCEPASSTLDDWFSDVVSNQTNKDNSAFDRVSAEFTKFQFTDRVSANTDPLAWWKKHEVLFPKLSRVAKRFLCTPATSVPATQVLTSTGKVQEISRSLLPSAEVDQLVFLNKNQKNNIQ